MENVEPEQDNINQIVENTSKDVKGDAAKKKRKITPYHHIKAHSNPLSDKTWDV